MSASLEQINPILSRRQLLTASLAAVGSTLLGACGELGDTPPPTTPTTERSPAATAGEPSAQISLPAKTNPLDLSRLPNGLLRAHPWQYDVDPRTPTYNKEAETYTENHATISHGQLTIEAIKTATGYESSRINTRGLFNFTHGTVTAVAKLPRGVGTWPALWLLPEEEATPRLLAKYGLPDDPDRDAHYYAWGGEIDWLETVGAENDPVNNHPAVHTHRSVSSGKEDGISPFIQPVPDGQTKFHEYGLRKNPGLLQFTLDGDVIHEVARKDGDTLAEWPFDDYRYYLIANLAMGGSWGGEQKDKYPPNGIDNTQAPWKFQIAELHFEPA